MSLKVYKQLISCTIVAALFGNTTAMASGTQKQSAAMIESQSQEIRDVFEEYQYYMDGWDGKDKEYKKEYDLRLRENLERLVEGGVKAQQIQIEMENRILNPQKKKEYQGLTSCESL